MRLGALGIYCVLGLAACEKPSPKPEKTESTPVVAAKPEKQSEEQIADETDVEEIWEAFYLNGRKVGHGWTRIEKAREQSRDVLKITSGVDLSVERFGEKSTQRVLLESTETPAGQLLLFRSELSSDDGRPLVTTGERSDRVSLILRQGNGRQSIPAGDDVGGFLAVEQSLERQPMKPGETRTLRHLFPLINQIAETKLTAVAEEEVALLDEKKRLLRIECVEKLSSGPIELVLWVDEAGRKWKNSMRSIKQDAYRTSRERATAGDGGPAYDLGEAPIVKLSKPLDRADETIEVVYRAQLPEGSIAGVFVDDASQEVMKIDERTCEVTVFASSAAARDDRDNGPAPADLASSSLLETDDKKVRVLAAAGAPADGKDREQLARSLARYVGDQMRPNSNYAKAIATAAETAASLEGDCTEHAMLLAALCRARGVPARVAIGLVYYDARQGFAYHMWTEAWNGNRWLSLDATRASGAVSAAYLKVAHSSLAGVDAYAAFLPVQRILGRLELEIVSVKYAP